MPAHQACIFFGDFVLHVCSTRRPPSSVVILLSRRLIKSRLGTFLARVETCPLLRVYPLRPLVLEQGRNTSRNQNGRGQVGPRARIRKAPCEENAMVVPGGPAFSRLCHPI